MPKIQTDAFDTRQRPQPEEGPLDILFEDEAILAVNKPAGVVVHPTYKNTSGTLLNAVLWRLRDRPGTQPGILTRLDKDTSGVVVIALTARLHASMQRDLIGHRVTKEYLALVCGDPQPSHGTITLPLGRSLEDRRIVIVREDGQASETRYEVTTRGTYAGAPAALVRCVLVTGRTHQIRVHLASSGWPIVGDRVYGAPDERIARQALHAWRVTFDHPVTRERLCLEAPLPPDIREASRNLCFTCEP